MLTRFVRVQLAIFSLVGVIGLIVMVVWYMQVPTLLGIGKMTVTLELPATGGLYRFSNVTYRGVQIGRVTDIALTPTGAKAVMRLDTSPNIPADLKAEVLSISAVGEYYVDLRPKTDSAPYLHDGSVISVNQATLPQPIGPVLDQSNALIKSIPKDKLSTLLDETYKGFNGAGYDFQSFFDSSAQLSHDFNGISDRTQTLTEDTGPFLNAQAQTADSIRTWARSLDGITGETAKDDPQFRNLLRKGPAAFDEASQLLNQIKPTLPVLLGNLATIGQIGVAYHASLEQVLVLLPPFTAAIQSFLPTKTIAGLPTGAFNLDISDPPACTVGFLPPSQWRSPADTRTVDTPDGLYCKLPQDSPIGVRGARNYPCQERPGKRAPTVEICESDKPFEPLAMRQHIFGTYPLDPNLIAQGIPPDDRMNWNRERIFGPVEGTPMPPGAVPRGPGAPPPPAAPVGPALPAQTMGEVSPIAPLDVPSSPAELPRGNTPSVPPAMFPFAPQPAAPPADSPPPAAPVADTPQPADAPLPLPAGPPGSAPVGQSITPSAFGGNASRPGPSVAIAQYDPRTGTYVTPDGHVFRQSDLVTKKAPKTWKDMFAI
ncbi:MlaD family protein [Mycobacterium shigaense]|uniref:MlaD family protein n=1 Tax=Mycobacterium shigaense TaxID=722731 RepID=UPI002ADFC00C|nr:MlaD family protein [Mycobacterium shigaense]MEA1120564.1 MlaD family protein [Mycobacterium shigaense]